MAELYNKVGLGLMTWSPVSLGLVSGNKEDQVQLSTKLAIKVYVSIGRLHDGQVDYCQIMHIRGFIIFLSLSL